MTKERVVVVFPGRGSYGASELGYLKRHHSARRDLLDQMDATVAENGGAPASKLDAMTKFSPATHLPGRNASNLIYACALADFAAIDRNKFEVVAVCGNSLGWYMALAAGGALSLANGARVVDAMGGLMEKEGVGGQILYPLTDADWRRDDLQVTRVQKAIQMANRSGEVFSSIDLGGVAVLAGDNPGLGALMNELPKIDDRYPFRLPRHAAFHTPLMESISAKALCDLPEDMFSQPGTPLIDGRGAVWTPNGTDLSVLHGYTFRTQITEAYDFSKSIEVALKEFAPDRLILTGPGASLGPPVGQILIRHCWKDLQSKADFSALQKKTPFVLAMGREDQRSLIELSPPKQRLA